MSSTSGTELEFARQLRRALDETTASLPSATVGRLAAARQAALARKKPELAAAPAFVPVFASAGALDGAAHAGAPRRRWPLRRFALAWPLAALVISLVAVAWWEDDQRTAELADIDAAMLSDNLPLSAWLDHGFDAYLSRTR
jgi:hypothetical protein